LLSPSVGLLYLETALILTSEEVISSVSVPLPKKTRRYEKFATSRFVWSNCIAELHSFAETRFNLAEEFLVAYINFIVISSLI